MQRFRWLPISKLPRFFISTTINAVEGFASLYKRGGPWLYRSTKKKKKNASSRLLRKEGISDWGENNTPLIWLRPTDLDTRADGSVSKNKQHALQPTRQAKASPIPKLHALHKASARYTTTTTTPAPQTEHAKRLRTNTPNPETGQPSPHPLSPPPPRHPNPSPPSRPRNQTPLAPRSAAPI